MEAVEARSDTRNKTIEASAADVFAALRDPERVSRWWGPDGFTSTVHAFQLHPGGRWHLTLHGPDGTDYPNEYRLIRLEADRLMELDHPSESHHFILTIELLPQGQNTVVLWQQTFDTIGEYQLLAEFLAQANEQVLERLSAEVRRRSSSV